MRLTVVGCSGSFPGPESAASCYLVEAEHEGRTWRILLDLGSGALGPLQRHADPTALDAVLVSHLHPDHCADLLGLYVVRRYRPEGPLPAKLPVHGPVATGERLAMMYHGLEPGGMDGEFAFAPVRDGQAFEVGPFRVTPTAVEHPVEAYGYRVEADGAVLAFSGDTDDCPGLDRLLAGADLALLDSAFVDGRDDARGIHLSGSRAAAAALRAGGVRRLVLTHVPAWNDREVCRAQAEAVWGGPVEVARAGDVVEVGTDVPAVDVLDRAAAHRMLEQYRATVPGLPPQDEVDVSWFGDSPGSPTSCSRSSPAGPSARPPVSSPSTPTRASDCRGSATTGSSATAAGPRRSSCAPPSCGSVRCRASTSGSRGTRGSTTARWRPGSTGTAASSVARASASASRSPTTSRSASSASASSGHRSTPTPEAGASLVRGRAAATSGPAIA